MEKDENVAKAKALILMGGFIGTKYYNRDVTDASPLPEIKFDLPVFTLNGEMDNSSVRSGESFFQQLTDFKVKNPQLNLSRADKYPMVLIKGMNHIQIADGDINNTASILKNAELRPEISLQEAHEQIAQLTTKFMKGESLQNEIMESYS